MNKRGTAIFFILMMGIIFFVLGLALAHPLQQVLSETMGASQLNCSNTDITQVRQAICTQTDMFLPLFTGLIFGLAGMLLAGIVS